MMSHQSNVYKTGQNKFDIGDMVFKCNHNIFNGYHVIRAVYNDFTYLIERVPNIRDNRNATYRKPYISSDEYLVSEPLSRKIIFEKTKNKFYMDLSKFAKAKMEEMLL